MQVNVRIAEHDCHGLGARRAHRHQFRTEPFGNLGRLFRRASAADNHAQGGATTGRYNINEPLRGALQLGPEAPIRGVLAQIEAVTDSGRALDPKALYVVWAGGHDIGAYLEFGQPDLKAQPPSAKTITDLGDGRTRMVSTSLADSFEDRDAMVVSGMESGIRDSFAKLDDLLAS